MKVKHLVVLIVAALLPLQSLHALDLYTFASYWDKEDADGTLGAGVGVTIPLFTDHLGLDARGYYFESSDTVADELDLWPIDLGLQVHFLPDEVLDPYILGGASYIYVDSDLADTDSEFGAYLGGGLDFKIVDHIKIFGEVVYRSAEITSDFGRFEEDIDISGITGNAGIKIHF